MRERREIIGNIRVKPKGKVNGIDAIELHGRTGNFLCMFGCDEDGWEHVSVSPIVSARESVAPCPTWQQMCEVKRMFFRDDETVVQVHPREDEYIHGITFPTNILHLWRPVDGDWSKLEEKAG